MQDALHKMKAAGQTALRYNSGQITDEELETKYHGELACTQDELYDLVNDAIGAFYVKNPTPIPYHPVSYTHLIPGQKPLYICGVSGEKPEPVCDPEYLPVYGGSGEGARGDLL